MKQPIIRRGRLIVEANMYMEELPDEHIIEVAQCCHDSGSENYGALLLRMQSGGLCALLSVHDDIECYTGDVNIPLWNVSDEVISGLGLQGDVVAEIEKYRLNRLKKKEANERAEYERLRKKYENE